MQCLYDIKTFLSTLYRILKPGGVLLATVPGIIRHEPDSAGIKSHWSFTTISARKLLEEAFPHSCLAVESYGNVLSATGFLHGLKASELKEEELLHIDPLYQTLISIRAVKS